MFTFFSILVVLSPIAAVVSATLWAISAVRKKNTKAKKVLAVSAALFAISFIGCALTAPPVDKTERDNQFPASQDIAPEQPQEPVSAPVENQNGNTTTVPQEPVETPQKPAQAGESENPLNDIPLQTRPVMNGFKTERIGTWAYIETTKADMKKVTDQQLKDYLTGLDDEDYNWFNVFFEDGTGLYCMTRMEGYYIEYGPMDKAEGGSVSYEDSRIYTFTDGVYQQTGGLVDIKAINAAVINTIPQKYQDEHWFFADCSESGNSGDEIAVSVQIDQGTNDLQVAKDIAAECYAVVKETVISAGCKLDRFDLMVVNKGSPVVGLMTEDGVNYTAISNGRMSEFTIP